MVSTFSGFKMEAKRSSLMKLFTKESKSISTHSQGLVFRNCSELTLDRFIEIVTSGLLTPLIKDGNPSEVELNEAWESIFNEYCDISNGQSQTYVLQLTREIKYLQWKITIINTIIERLKLSYVPELCDILRDYGFYYDYTPDTMLTDIISTVAEGQFLSVQLGVKKAEYDKYLASNEGKTSTANDYDEILSELSKFQGYHLRAKDLSVSEYVSIFNRFKKQNGGQTNN